MRIKNVKIEIKPLGEALKEAAAVMSRIRKKEQVKLKKSLGFASIGSFREFFTPKRLELLHVIRHRSPESIYELAKMTGRDFKSVVTDLKILEKHGLIDTKKKPVKGGYKVKPELYYDKLTVDIAV